MHAANPLRAKVAGIIQECRINAPSLGQFICLVSVMTDTKFLMLTYCENNDVQLFCDLFSEKVCDQS